MSGSLLVEHLDHVIVGAGLSGIGAACHLGRAFPERSYAVLEARPVIGGTWDLFRYPGVRSDSDMYTLGYRFKPWTGGRTLADGASIRAYIRQTAREHGIDRHVRFHRRLTRADWCSDEGRWHLTVEHVDTGETSELTCTFLMSTTGYYRYDEGYTPEFAGVEDFAGRVIHPQHWPADLDHAGKRIVVIGSGATAVTLVPNLAQRAAHVTMLQRSPTYIISQPVSDAVTEILLNRLPARLASRAVRTRYLAMHVGFYEFCRRRPAAARALLRKLLQRQLPDDFDVDTHFTPTYEPWDQRLCLVPDGDLFRALGKHTVEIVTDHIDTFTPTGIRLRSGRELEADIVVTATGLNLLMFGGVQLSLDGTDVHLPDHMTYKGMMLSGVPNFAFVLGYTNASWTLKADLVCEHTVKILRHLGRTGNTVVVPRRDPEMKDQPFIDITASYVLRSLHQLPTQGSSAPWRLRMNYFLDRLEFTRARADDGILEYSTPVTA